MSHPAAPRESLEGLFAGPQDVVERLPTLRLVLEKAASNWVEQICKISATAPSIALTGVDSGPAESMIAAVSNQAAACVLEATDWNARLIVSADQQFAFAVVEMLLGGDGSEPQPAADRPLTRSELRVTHLVFEQFASALEVAFGAVAPTHFGVGAASARVGFDVLGRMTVPIVAARFKLSVLGVSGDLTLLMSQSVLSPMRNELSRPPAPEAIMPDPAWSQKIQSEVTRANVDLVAVLDEQSITLAEVAHFAVGQMLKLGATPEGLVLVECNGERLINCQIGKSNGVYTLRVHDFIDQEQEFMEDVLAS
jgi:flagellar motor switch protein FliM